MSTGNLRGFPSEQDLWSDASETIRTLGLKTLDDLRFRLTCEAEASEAGLLAQWKCLDGRGSGVSTAALPVLDTKDDSEKAPKFIPLDAPVVKRREKFAAAPLPAQECGERFEVASIAMKLSASWSPDFGLIADSKFVTDEWKNKAIEEISKFEVRAIRGALSCWEAWRDWAGSEKIPVICSERVAWESFILAGVMQ